MAGADFRAQVAAPVVAPPAPNVTHECPNCGAINPVDAGFSPWCDRCDWNLWPYGKRARRGPLAPIYSRLDGPAGRRLLNQAIASPAPSRLSASLIVALAVALSLYALVLAAAILGLVLVIVGLLTPLMLAGLAMIGIAWEMRPRLARLEGTPLDRHDAPSLYRELDRIADALASPRLAAVVPSADFNAGYTRIGLRQKPVMYIGLPLWAILDPGERVALLGHELGHGANHDPLRGLVVGNAVASLVTLHSLLIPDVLWLPGSISSLLALPFRVAMLLLAKAVLAVAWLLALLVLHDSQRAEYRADAAGARASGSIAFGSMLDKLNFAPTYRRTVEGVAAGSGKGVFTQFAEAVARTPERELERLRRLNRLTSFAVDATHPPTAGRIQALEAHPVPSAGITLSDADSDAIDAEFAPSRKRLAAALVERARDRLYR